MHMEKIMLFVIMAYLFSIWSEKTVAEQYHCAEIDVPIARCQCECRLPASFRIVGGMQALPHEFPWLVAILSPKKNFLGGGTLITSKHVLTAAHLTTKHKKGLSVMLGAHEKQDLRNGVQIPVKAIKITRPFKRGQLSEDIAILVLQKSVPFGKDVKPACLPPAGSSSYDGMKGIVAGWGIVHEKSYEPAEALQKTLVPIVSLNKCNTSYSMKISKDMICAGYPEGEKDACQGDSGGPLHVLHKSFLEVVGIVSFGKGCGRPNAPGVYTRTSSFIAWIQKAVGQECLCQLPHYK